MAKKNTAYLAQKAYDELARDIESCFNEESFSVITSSINAIQGLAQKLRNYFTLNREALLDIELFAPVETKGIIPGFVAAAATHQVLYEKIIPVQQGFNGSILDGLTTHASFQPFLSSLQNDVLVGINRELGQWVNQPEKMTAFRHSSIVKRLANDKAFEKHQKDFAKLFDKKGMDVQKYGKLIGNDSSWPEVVSKYNDCVTIYNSVKPAAVVSLMDDVVKSVDIVEQRMVAKDERYTPNTLGAKELSLMLYAAATQVQFYSTIVFSFEPLSRTLMMAYSIRNPRQKAGIVGLTKEGLTRAVQFAK